LLLRRLKQVSTALGLQFAVMPSLELPKLAPTLQVFQLLLHHGLGAPLLLPFMLRHGTSPFLHSGSLPSFFHRPTSTFTTTSQQHHANLDHDTNQGTSLHLLGEISGIGINNRAGNPSSLRHFDINGLATLNGSFGSQHQLSMVFAILTRKSQHVVFWVIQVSHLLLCRLLLLIITGKCAALIDQTLAAQW
jgi:hypothetical protein